MRITKAVITFLFVISFQCMFSAAISAQAWLPPRGEGTYTIAYENFYVKNHLDSDGNRFFDGTIRASGLFQEVDYGLTKRVALDVSLPYLRAKYNGITTGPFTGPHQLPIDNGDYHGAFQDFHFNIRYSLRARPLQVTPFFEAVIPSHSYEYFAHSGVGTRMREYQFGVDVGRRLDPILPRAYFQARYSYGVTQRVIGIRPNRSRLNAEFGYFFTKRLSLSALESLVVYHSGIEDPQLNDQNWPFHDQIYKVALLNVGVGADFAVTKSLDVFGSLVTTVWGWNAHALHDAFTVGMTWRFRTRRAEGPGGVPPQHARRYDPRNSRFTCRCR